MEKVKIPAAKHLNESEYRLLLNVHQKHTCSMGLDERNKYTLSDIIKVEKNTKAQCLNVYYNTGDWWHYSVNGTWY